MKNKQYIVQLKMVLILIILSLTACKTKQETTSNQQMNPYNPVFKMDSLENIKTNPITKMHFF